MLTWFSKRNLSQVLSSSKRSDPTCWRFPSQNRSNFVSWIKHCVLNSAYDSLLLYSEILNTQIFSKFTNPIITLCAVHFTASCCWFEPFTFEMMRPTNTISHFTLLLHEMKRFQSSFVLKWPIIVWVIERSHHAACSRLFLANCKKFDLRLWVDPLHDWLYQNSIILNLNFSH